MKVGRFHLPGSPTRVSELIAEIEETESLGFASSWVANIVAGPDALMVLALAGSRTASIELGTFVVPTFPRHPSVMAQQALTAQAMSGGRLTLGIGLSHRVVMEDRLGFDWDHPIRHAREYLQCLRPMLAGEPVTFDGAEYQINDFRITMPDVTPPPILVAALGPQMLKLTGQLADGTAVWMGGARYLREQAVPAIRSAAEEAGRQAPRIVASLPVCVTDRVDEVKQEISRAFARYGQLPSYRAILDREGAEGPADVALVGSEDEARAGLRELADAGVTDFAAAVYARNPDDRRRTIAFLQEAARAS